MISPSPFRGEGLAAKHPLQHSQRRDEPAADAPSPRFPYLVQLVPKHRLARPEMKRWNRRTAVGSGVRLVFSFQRWILGPHHGFTLRFRHRDLGDRFLS